MDGAGVDRKLTSGRASVIERVEVLTIDIPAKFPRKDAIQPFEKQETPIVRVFSKTGAVGTGYTYTLGTGGSALVALIADYLAPQLLGQDARYVEELWRKLYRSINSMNPGITSSLALAPIDMALWDIRCQEAGLPLHLLAGGAQRRVPLYDTEGGWLNLPMDEIVANGAAAASRGFLGFKVKVGHRRKVDFERLAAVREALPDHIELMTDANQIFALDDAVRRAGQYEELGIAWFEEPLPADDLSGHARLVRSTSVPIAVGETLHSPAAFREYLQAEACSVVQVDAARVGGITPWLKVAHMAQAFNVAVAPHYLMELHVSLAAAVPNARWVEHIPQLDEVLETPLAIDQQGYAVPPTAPGLGLDWSWNRVGALQRSPTIVLRP